MIHNEAFGIEPTKDDPRHFTGNERYQYAAKPRNYADLSADDLAGLEWRECKRLTVYEVTRLMGRGGIIYRAKHY